MKQKQASRSSLSLYLEEIKKYPLLDNDSKEHLNSMLLSLDPKQVKEAKEIYIQSNLRLVVSIAKRYQSKASRSLEDLIQEGNVGLSLAAERYDPNKGIEFSTYATYYIESYIKEEARSSSLFPLPRLKRIARAKILAIASKLKSEGKEGNSEEIRDELPEYSLELIEELLQLPYQAEEDIDIVSNEEDNPLPIEEIERTVSDLALLSKKEQFVVKSYFGLDGNEKKTLSEIGEALGCSKERARQIKETALFKLEKGRKPSWQ